MKPVNVPTVAERGFIQCALLLSRGVQGELLEFESDSLEFA